MAFCRNKYNIYNIGTLGISLGEAEFTYSTKLSPQPLQYRNIHAQYEELRTLPTESTS